MHRDFENGIRQAPAFSQVTVEDLAHNEHSSWQEITADIESEGIPASLVTENQDFVRNWINKVILEEADENNEDKQSPPWPPSATPPEDAVAELSLGPARMEAVGTAEDQGPEIAPRPRAPSFSSHSSKASSWRPVDGPNRDYVQGLLAKLLEPESSTSGDMPRITRIAKRIYHQLDWADRGFLYRFTVEDEFRHAIFRAKIALSEIDLSKLIITGDENSDGKLDCAEFVGLIFNLLAYTKTLAEKALQEQIEADIQRGKKDFLEAVLKWVNAIPENAKSWGWQLSQANIGHWNFAYGLGEYIKSATFPPIDLASFKILSYAATHICIPRVGRTLDKWSEKLISLPPEQYDEYHGPIDAVLNVASKFFIFERTKSSVASYNTLDEFITLSEMVPIDEDPRYDRCPLLKVMKLRDQCDSVLSSILGFIAAMDPGVHDKPPALDKWQKMKMRIRANRISEASECFADAESVIELCKVWFEGHLSLNDDAVNGLKEAVALRTTQLSEEARIEAKLENRIILRVIRANNLSKLSRFSTLSSRIFCLRIQPQIAHFISRTSESGPWNRVGKSRLRLRRIARKDV